MLLKRLKNSRSVREYILTLVYLKTNKNNMKSSLLTLDSKDFIKGFLVSVITAIVTVVYNTIQTGTLAFDWKAIAIAALSAGLAYITKNLLTNSQDQFLKKEPIVEPQENE